MTEKSFNSLHPRYKISFEAAPGEWKKSFTSVECSFHQLAPYIGKVKSGIAGALIKEYSCPGDLVVDPFCGAGTIPLESVIQKRRTIGADISPYAAVLTRAKLYPPPTLECALQSAEDALCEARELPDPNLLEVPGWVQDFFHQDTLREVLRFSEVARRPGNEFIFACLLGILHHQRPGFLSFPSSHLVPYLRNKKFPRDQFPEMYTYRDLRPRLFAKIVRSFKRAAPHRSVTDAKFQVTDVQNFTLPHRIDALITSPPYMNALDYGRDNRLRLWVIDPSLEAKVDKSVMKQREAFSHIMTVLVERTAIALKSKGYCIFIVGETLSRSYHAHPSEIVMDIVSQQFPMLALQSILVDEIPDIRRARKEKKGVKTEHILIFKKK